MSARQSELAAALTAVRGRIEGAARAAGRPGAEIELLPITKYFPATDVAILSGLGCRAFGESRVQEAAAKAAELPGLDWHMVGRIQRNKVASVAAWAHTVHSVGGIELADALDRAVAAALAGGRRSRPLHVYVQVSLDGDTARGGVSGDGAIDALCDRIEASAALKLVGLMGIPPLDWDPEVAFARLHAQHQRVRENHPGATGLSAGMSGDLETAVKHGSTCVRVGTAVMGPRRLRSP